MQQPTPTQHRRADHREPGIDVPVDPGEPAPYPENPDLPGDTPVDPVEPGKGQPIPPEMDNTEPRL